MIPINKNFVTLTQIFDLFQIKFLEILFLTFLIYRQLLIILSSTDCRKYKLGEQILVKTTFLIITI